MNVLAPLDCPVCKVPKINYEENRRAGHCVCVDCGCVLCDYVDSGPEWRNFSGEDGEPDRSRVGGAFDSRFEDGGVTTQVPRRFRRAETRRSTSDRRKQRLFERCRRFGSALNLNSRVTDAACRMICAQQENDDLPEREAGPLCAAVLYLTCRAEGCPRTANDVALACFLPKKRLSRALQRLKQALVPRCQATCSSIDGRFCNDPAEFSWFDNAKNHGVVCRRHCVDPWVPQGLIPKPLPSAAEEFGQMNLRQLCERVCVDARLAFRFVRVVYAAAKAVWDSPPPSFCQSDVEKRVEFREDGLGGLVRVSDGTTMRAALHGGNLPGDTARTHVPLEFDGQVARFADFNMVNRAATKHEPETLARACAYGVRLKQKGCALTAEETETCTGTAVSVATLVSAHRTASCVGGFKAALAAVTISS